MKTCITFFVLFMISIPLQAQGTLIGICEGCEAVFEYGDRELTATDTLPGFHENEPKIKISGTIYEQDGKTPAEGVILYVYHTNREGEYATRGDETGWARRHGYIRAWLKTGAKGRYTFYTYKPGSYSRNPAHIHPIILEPNGRYYWLGSYLFEDDPNLSRRQLDQQNPRGGSNGILKLQKENDLLVGKRDIILGRNVEGYK
ncbi:MAG: intradiol ring-cleavage dioxygenase [Gracilimonas sp.]|uniref:hypothetical protein n=1 Tax=Gracilimonas sp. TaxID=1974203 RepID=UPI0019A9928A|nr:hypothetical protein [Gracilimonas sp.]MBD3617371.1 intradiol ring-cleavage dioxygenase [Gracilimonas sp.]